MRLFVVVLFECQLASRDSGLASRGQMAVPVWHLHYRPAARASCTYSSLLAAILEVGEVWRSNSCR